MAAINKVGIIGAGQMGNGIAHVCAAAGFDVLLEDVNKEALDKALATISYNMSRQIQRGVMTDEAKKAAMARITPATSTSPARTASSPLLVPRPPT